MQDLYETNYGIYPHIKAGNDRRTPDPKPLASVAFHECEDPNKNSLLEEAFRMYASKGIKELFGLSVLEFLDLPLDIVQMLKEIADEHAAKRARMTEDIEKEFQKR